MFFAWRLALLAIISQAIPESLAYTQQALAISIDQITLNSKWEMVNNSTSWDIPADNSSDMVIPVNQSEKWEGLIIDYKNNTSLEYKSRLGYLLLVDRSTLTGSPDDLQGYNWNTTNGILVYSANGPNVCGLYTAAFDRPCLIISPTTAKNLLVLISTNPTSDSVQQPHAEGSEDLSMDAIYLRLALTKVDAPTQSLESTDTISSSKVMITGAVIGGLLGLVLICLMVFCTILTVRRRRSNQGWAARRQQGIQSLITTLNDKSPRPLDPQLLQYLRLVNTRQEPLATLERATGSVFARRSMFGKGFTAQSDLIDEATDWGAGGLPAFPLPPPPTLTASRTSVDSESAASSFGKEKEKPNEKWVIRVVDPLTVSTSNPMVTASSQAIAIAITSRVTQAGDDTCTICLDDIAKGQTVRQLPCLHIYHVECIDEWLVQKSSACPLCKADCAPHCIQLAGPSYRPPEKPKDQPTESNQFNYIL
ncbi:hypothetical protein H4R33_000640 [Dimargaris cristalligena]|uniref:RING-type E3 ubiquitin transferase n=1 Tax=Dimargaris cristalligena TaxID=215637 RepID=A0A4Q0A345_9FUNG|nr:hypothetical protein H4R33_000640 [Dimargaris cristalligena]RKP39822.1 hypothetical protein BJ085DRAFT_38298 [Dimargaris cristalligena]|eukprot:RKP39822.1 hypothetical protein BJ085DRAFT_38298 [Dimargaris cristalligena]